jgi:hypothetical protein
LNGIRSSKGMRSNVEELIGKEIIIRNKTFEKTIKITSVINGVSPPIHGE